MKSWKKELKDILTEEQIKFIIKTRRAGTYRWLAARFAEKYPSVGVNPGNQIDGIQLVDAVKELGYQVRD